MKTLVAKSMWTMAVMAVLGVTTSVAQAGHYNHIDDHARDIEREAERSRRIVKHEFSRLPFAIRHCINTNLYLIEEAADCIGDLTRRPGNLEDIAEHVEVISVQLAEVDDHVDELRTWCRSCDVPRHLRSSCGTMFRGHERSLRELCQRITRIRAELDCLVTELNELLSACGGIRHRHHRHDDLRRPAIVVPPPVPRPPVVQPSSRLEIGSSRHGSVWSRHDSWGRTRDFERSSRFGRSRSACGSSLYGRGGSGFGFSLSLR